MIVTDEVELRKPNQEVLVEEVDELVSKLEQGLIFSRENNNPGIGLAAPQIGIHKKIAIIRLGQVQNMNCDINLVNAKIAHKYKEQPFQEGCLSIPNKTITTNRAQEIHVTNNLVEPHSFIATGLLAVAVQHEIDHYNGILMIDREIKPKKNKPNLPCNCNSGKKAKVCCLKK